MERATRYYRKLEVGRLGAVRGPVTVGEVEVLRMARDGGKGNRDNEDG